MRKVEQRFRVRHRPKGSTKIRSTNHSNRPENGEAKDRQQARYRLQIGIEAQIGAEQKRSKAIERHRKETPQRALSQQRLKSLGAKAGNRQSPTTAMPATRIAVPDTRQRGNPNPHQEQKAESLPRDTKPLPPLTQACKDIIDVFNQINNDSFRADLRMKSRLGDNEAYGLSNEYEMLAEMSNPVFRAALKAKKLWRQLINGVRRILQLDVLGEDEGASDAYTILNNALNTIIDNFDAQSYSRYVAFPVMNEFNKKVEDNGYETDMQRKEAQLEIINRSNPAPDDYHTWVRSTDDILTLQEAVDDVINDDSSYNLSSYPDVSDNTIREALRTGRIRVYSSYPIKNGVFVTPSKMQAMDYAGDGKVYSKEVPISDIAWINTDEGQYAAISKNTNDIEDDGGAMFRDGEDKKTASGKRGAADSHNPLSGSLLSGSSERLSGDALAYQIDDTKVQRNTEITRRKARIILNKGGFDRINTPMQAVSALGKGLGMRKSYSTQSYYGDYYEGDFSVDGKILHLRISTHPANGTRIGNALADDKISLVVRKNGEHVSLGEHNGYTEYVYEPSEILPKDAANGIVRTVERLIRTGEFVDETGKVQKYDYPYNDENGNIRYRTVDAASELGKKLEAIPEEDLVETYRNVQLFADDSMGSPMAYIDKETGEVRTIEGGKWDDSNPQKIRLTDEQIQKLGELNENGFVINGLHQRKHSHSMRSLTPQTYKRALLISLEKYHSFPWLQHYNSFHGAAVG